jgi:tetratricopeptide (TPR) repeat protein
MGIHERRDHSLRIPRPDLSMRLGTPNACNQCHMNQTPAWADNAITHWFPKLQDASATADNDFAPTLGKAWDGNASTESILRAIQTTKSGMAKASLLALLPPGDSAIRPDVLKSLASDPEGLVRLGVARALSATLTPATLPIGITLLDDPLLAVRVEAARALGRYDPSMLTERQLSQIKKATDELIRVELASADRPEAHVNLALIYMNMGQADHAENALRTALRLDPDLVPALVNLADLYRLQNRDADAEPLLRRAVKKAPTVAEPAHALGLLLVRRGKRTEALSWLKKAVELAPSDIRYSEVLGVAEKEFGIVGEGQNK